MSGKGVTTRMISITCALPIAVRPGAPCPGFAQSGGRQLPGRTVGVVAPNGRWDAVWYDDRDFPADLNTFHIYATHSTDDGTTWTGPDEQVTDAATNLNIGIPTGLRRNGAAGDYIGVTSMMMRLMLSGPTRAAAPTRMSTFRATLLAKCPPPPQDHLQSPRPSHTRQRPRLPIRQCLQVQYSHSNWYSSRDRCLYLRADVDSYQHRGRRHALRDRLHRCVAHRLLLLCCDVSVLPWCYLWVC